ncbi:MAG: glucose-1-phosphate cytidylyltransferase [Nitrospinales bacterium]
MQTVILAGGFGTRLREETEFRPKPMVQIGNHPILWHILKIYSYYGFNDFIICLGYKGEQIKEYFINYEYMNNDITVKTGSSKCIEVHSNHNNKMDEWNVTLVDTGHSSMTGCRVKQIEKFIDEDIFFLTYGDGLAQIDLKELLAFHRSHGKTATITGVHPPSRFGELTIENHRVVEFTEKPQIDSGCINGGFFVFNKRIFDYLSLDKDCYLEYEPMERLVKDGELMVYVHKGFWHCMDTQRDLTLLNSLWKKDNPPWKIWT